MENNILKKIIQIRIAVGFLMEEHKWWHSSFFAPITTEFLGYIFPKSIKLNSDFYLEAIRHSIDSEVGANYYHLFRLPIHVEEKLFKNASLSAEEIVPNMVNALELLENSAKGLNVEQHQGPINIGSSEQLNEDVIQAFAAYYFSAFENNY